MGNAQQMHYVENKRQFELAQNKILNRLNEQGYFEHNGLTCWNNPLNDDTEPEAFRPQWLEEEYHIIFNKKAGEYCVIGDDEKMQREQEEKIASERKLQVGAGDRAERIRTYNYPQGRVTDHRIGLTLYKLEQILNGDLTELFDALNTFDQAEKLKESSGSTGGEN